MNPYIGSQPRRANDEKGVLTLVGITVFAVLCMFALGYALSSYRSQEQQERQSLQAQYETYRRATAAPAEIQRAPAAVPPEILQAQALRARLLAHPSVTPGPGFDRPGVQSTGATIVDAIDQALARRLR